MNNKGFLLIDSLLVVAIVSNISLLCFSVYRVIDSDENTRLRYEEYEKDFYYSLFLEYPDCEVCTVNEPD